MPRGHDSLSLVINGKTIDLDYTYHRYQEPEGSYLDWDIVALYIDNKPASNAEIQALDQRILDRFDAMIRDRH